MQKKSYLMYKLAIIFGFCSVAIESRGLTGNFVKENVCGGNSQDKFESLSFPSLKQENLIVRQAVGRAFRLGDIYDVTTDTNTGLSLWKPETISKYHDCKAQPFTQVDVALDDTIRTKTNIMSLKLDLALSFFYFITIHASGSYVTSHTSSVNDVRVSLKYSTKTRFEQLTMDQLGNIEYPEVLDHPDATHVVVGITYGANAVLMLHKTVVSSSDSSETRGALGWVCHLIPKLDVTGDGRVDMTGVPAWVNQTTVSYFGDLGVKVLPTTFADAVKLYHSLPSLLGDNGENAVPVEVWLYPLAKLDSRALREFRSISASITNSLETMQQNLIDAGAQGNGFADSWPIGKQFPAISAKNRQFADFVNTYRLRFNDKMKSFIQNIRRAVQNESVLIDAISDWNTSPFSLNNFEEWKSANEKEQSFLSGFLASMNSTKFLSGDDLQHKLDNLDISTIITITYSLPKKSPLLDQMESYLKSPEPQTKPIKIDLWFENPSILSQWFKKSMIFKSFVNANLNRSDIQFFQTSDVASDKAEININLYQSPLHEKQEVNLPGPPEKIQVKKLGSTVKLSWAPPKEGQSSIETYELAWLLNDFENPNLIKTKELFYNFAFLQSGRRYTFFVRGITKFGYGPYSEQINYVV